DRLVFFPIRHHSPACTWHLQKVIDEEKPAAILIEGPEDITPLIPTLLDPRTKPPVAIYTTFVDRRQTIEVPLPGWLDAGPPRFAGFYPFCDYTPELVALKTGQKIGAQLKFIDLTFPEQILAGATPVSRALLDESVFRRSAYLAALARRAGCRDHNELWDHLFEASFLQLPTDVFVRNVVGYCLMARQDSSTEMLQADGTLAREQAMAAAIQEELALTTGKILVVTGGFHTVVLPKLIQQPVKRPKKPKLAEGDAQTVVMRYSFEQLDALNGYAAGMPSPNYYQQTWEHLQAHPTPSPSAPSPQPSAPAIAVAAHFLITIGRLTRDQNGMTPLSSVDEISALGQARQLARFRGHTSGPTREDLLDGIRSCFVKGAMDTEGKLLLETVQKLLTGDQIGDLPPTVGVPPLVEDFRCEATSLRLKIGDSTPKSINLDVYRKKTHRRASRFFHRLKFLQVFFARLTAGPDFARGTGLERLQEQWEYQWTPLVETKLVEQSLFGTTVEEAALNLLVKTISDLETEGKSRSAIQAVRLLVAACQMGLHRSVSRLLALISENIHQDPDFSSLVEALEQLLLLWQSREPLEAHHLTVLPEFSQAAFHKACFLIPELAGCPAEMATNVVESLASLREMISSTPDQILDETLFYSALEPIPLKPDGNPLVCGGVVGILFSAGKISESAVLHFVRGFLEGASASTSDQIGFLQGLLKTCREAAWNLSGLLALLDEYLTAWSEDDFLRILPELRLSFADLTPRETDRVAEMVAHLHGQPQLNLPDTRTLSEEALRFGLHLNQLILESLHHDGLAEKFGVR
ncbi:MAG TPA: DUF5682 family protein, partial [Acidobacteriota bacterium]|nr:DUF5682 family protein [Acidobacteriota bacterium]